MGSARKMNTGGNVVVLDGDREDMLEDEDQARRRAARRAHAGAVGGRGGPGGAGDDLEG